MLEPGTNAPDFTLATTQDNSFTLSKNKGKRTILAFYPADWSPVCTDQMSLYNEMLDYFSNLNATLVGISVDGKWCHAAFSHNRKLDFPLLSDFERKGFVSKKYEAFDDQAGESFRALFVIDENGFIRWTYLSPPNANPGADGIIQALEELNQQQLMK
ncbi:redoxin domain-containing protein [Pedobacter sp.]|jgi:peroxiredoxin|uniref:redoxin domain-containing protein n=1 Tax=Pedobacter sp. TaxID=1411316 RepID=UPI002BA0476C|nr:redoxin domain-containing protein [Pedobacter sp.]HWW39198.1 redoxin domain-containing protein [Pedobacter sp.]